MSLRCSAGETLVFQSFNIVKNEAVFALYLILLFVTLLSLNINVFAVALSTITGVCFVEDCANRSLTDGPYAGVVTKRLVELGETVAPGTPLLSGFSLDTLRVEVELPQSSLTCWLVSLRMCRCCCRMASLLSRSN